MFVDWNWSTAMMASSDGKVKESGGEFCTKVLAGEVALASEQGRSGNHCMIRKEGKRKRRRRILKWERVVHTSHACGLQIRSCTEPLEVKCLV